jgi:hypothetical protein
MEGEVLGVNRYSIRGSKARGGKIYESAGRAYDDAVGYASTKERTPKGSDFGALIYMTLFTL